MISALKKAVDLCDGQSELARRLSELTGQKITQQRIWNIIHRSKKVPAEFVIPIERATGGKVTRYQLRDDIWPADEAPSSATEAA
jgi:DNA-binding transcriptional regulator YdaS (Cro superfamily)